MVKSVYIHIPFCNKICSYCDFCKVFYNKKWINSYLDSLENEIKQDYKNEQIETIYIGGGTPSSLSIEELNKLFEMIKLFKLNNNYEFTIECNVEDITKEKLELFKNNKVNRLSIGVESFNDQYLKYLNRSYKSEDIKNKINLAKKYFNNINIDLIYALQNQTLDELEKDLEEIIKLDVTHVSCYSLIIEEHTKLFIDNVKPISSDLDYEMYKLINKKFKGIYDNYEISNYAKKGYESRCNLTYWHNEEYYGFGLSSASYIDNKRYNNTKNLTKYINKNYDRNYEYLTNDDKVTYELILGFRLRKGINIDNFYNKYKLDILSLNKIDKLLKDGYLEVKNNYIFVKEDFVYVLNDILINFV